MQNDVRRKTEYDLGWDYAMYGLNLPEALAAVSRKGFELGKSNFQGKTKTSDRFIRKWLQLRLNAYRRGRLVNDDVTPAFIQEIDTDECPITLLKLTHGELLETDWSVDRLNNNGAYARDNLAIISTKANSAKGNKSFEEVVALWKGTEAVEGLTPMEWLRLAVLMFGVSLVEDKSRDMLLPLATKIPNQCMRPEWFQLQYCLVLVANETASKRNKHLKKLHTLLRKQESRDSLDRISSRLEVLRRDVTYPYDVMVDEKIQANLRPFFLNMGSTSRADLKEWMLEAAGGEQFKEEKVRLFSFSTKGYVGR